MAKPILVIRMPDTANEYFNDIQKSIRNHINNEYHVIVVGQETDEPRFEVFNVDKEPEIKYSELKKLINKEVEA